MEKLITKNYVTYLGLFPILFVFCCMMIIGEKIMEAVREMGELTASANSEASPESFAKCRLQATLPGRQWKNKHLQNEAATVAALQWQAVRIVAIALAGYAFVLWLAA